MATSTKKHPTQSRRWKASLIHVPRDLRERFPDLLTVSDADIPVKVTMDAAAVENGKTMMNGACAMACAIEATGEVDGARIGMTYSWLVSENGTHATRYKTPDSVQREIVSFDRHKDFDLGEYQLSAIPPAERFGQRKQVKSQGQRTGKRPRSPAVVHSTRRIRPA